LAQYASTLCPASADKIVVISNGIDAVGAAPVRLFPAEEVVFVTACDVRPKKDLETLVLAFQDLCRDVESVRLLVVGIDDPSQRTALAAR
jgi:glycosyltransferase involved in cell wall biosynthesis